MWNAMGQCYDKMDKKNEAVKCYDRAVNGKDKEGNMSFNPQASLCINWQNYTIY